MESKKKIIATAVITVLILGVFLSISSMAAIYRPALREVEYQYVSYHIRDYQVIETENYIIRHPGFDEELLSYIVKTAEDKYIAATEVFNYKPKEKVRMVLYNDLDEMMDATMLRKGNPPMGVYYGNTIHISNPLIWFSEEEYKEGFYREGPILHELVHLLTDHIANGNFPTWFTEGVSLYMEYQVDKYQWGYELSGAEVDFSIEELTHDFHQLNQYRAYAKSFRLVSGFVDKYGLEELLLIIEKLGEGEKFSNYKNLF